MLKLNIKASNSIMSSIVNGNVNITIPVIEHVEYLYSYF